MPENTDISLTSEVKKMAGEWGAELVGIASVDRFANAPLLHSPQGLLPGARSVVVVATIWMDAAIELTEKEIAEHWWNPADVCEARGGFAARLNPLVLKLASFLERRGYPSLPLPQTCYWRWRPYKSMKDAFAPPMVHRYAAVAAGLGEIGWHNSFMTPQYGPRQRLVSLVTEAPLAADPLYDGDPLCDMCMRCVKACPYGRFNREVEEVVELDIGGKKMKMPRTNKWRCHLCYYEINPRFLPRTIDEETAVRIENDGRAPRGGILMDSAACLAACMPPKIRGEDPNLYPNSVSRNSRKPVDIAPEDATKRLTDMARAKGVDYLFTASRDDFLNRGIDLRDFMPYAASIVMLGSRYPHPSLKWGSRAKLWDAGYDTSRCLQEEMGGYTLQLSERLTTEEILRAFGEDKDEQASYYHLITAVPLRPVRIVPEKATRGGVITAGDIKSFLREKGADLVGIASVERLDRIRPFLESTFGGDRTIVAENKPETIVTGGPDHAFTASGIESVTLQQARDYLPEARSVIVIGLHYPDALAERAAAPPAENVGPYCSFVRNDSMTILQEWAYDLARLLRGRGYQAAVTADLEGFGSAVHLLNRFPAVCAGLGEIGRCGMLLTPEFGATQRCLTVITDAVLDQDEVYKGAKLCIDCHTCARACPVGAIGDETVRLSVDGAEFEFAKVDRLRCEWANRFGLVGEEGPKYMGCRIDIPPPENIGVDSFNQAMEAVRKLDVVSRLNWNLTFEKCAASCPVRGHVDRS